MSTWLTRAHVDLSPLQELAPSAVDDSLAPDRPAFPAHEDSLPVTTPDSPAQY